MFSAFIYFAAVHCPAFEYVPHSTMSSGDTMYGSVVNYTCASGYELLDLTTEFSVTCLIDGTWSMGNISNMCQRKLSTQKFR